MNEMHTVQMPFAEPPKDDIRNLGYGLDWFIGDYRGFRHIYHGGVVDGFAAHVALLPEKNIELVILTNSSSDGLAAAAFIQQVIFDKTFGLNIEDPLPERRPLPIDQKIKSTPCRLWKTT